jgi:hypothetical protein
VNSVPIGSYDISADINDKLKELALTHLFEIENVET